jgi:hypothetical protein
MRVIRQFSTLLLFIPLLSCATRGPDSGLSAGAGKVENNYQTDRYEVTLAPISFEKPCRYEYSFEVPHDSKGSVMIEVENPPRTDPYSQLISSSKLSISIYEGDALVKTIKEPLTKWWHTGALDLGSDARKTILSPQCLEEPLESPMTTEFTEQGTVTRRPVMGRTWASFEKPGTHLRCDEFWLRKGTRYRVVFEIANYNSKAASYSALLKVLALWPKERQ